MSSYRIMSRVAGIALATLVLVACGTSQRGPAPTVAPPEPTSTPTPRPTSTPVLVEAEPEAGAPWDYVALGDSHPAGLGVGRDQSYVHVYAEHIEADLGVTVTVHNYAQVGATTEFLLWSLQHDAELRNAISEAEVVTIWAGWNDVSSLVGWGSVPGVCRDDGVPDVDCVRRGVASIKANIDDILTEILALTSTDRTLIRITDNCNVMAGPWKEAGTFEALKEPGFEEWSHYIDEAASKRGIPVVHSYAAMNGSDGDEAVPAEYLLTDGVHFTAEGHALIADLHRELGYWYTVP